MPHDGVPVGQFERPEVPCFIDFRGHILNWVNAYAGTIRLVQQETWEEHHAPVQLLERMRPEVVYCPELQPPEAPIPRPVRLAAATGRVWH
jgi:hypothetical protein